MVSGELPKLEQLDKGLAYGVTQDQVSEGDQQQLQQQVERLEKMVVLVGWEVVVMVDWEVMMLVIWVGGGPWVIRICSPASNSSSTPILRD